MHINSTHGLSQNHGMAIIKDYKGFMWFGTLDGLNKYDGYKITVYKNIPNDPFSISSNEIWALLQDSENNLWVGTNHGLNVYDREKDRFVIYKEERNNPKPSAVIISQPLLKTGRGISGWEQVMASRNLIEKMQALRGI